LRQRSAQQAGRYQSDHELDQGSRYFSFVSHLVVLAKGESLRDDYSLPP
jgi:hypothetical protein